MGSTMLQLVQQVTNELGVPTPNNVAGNTSQDVIQINALMNAVGYELLRRADWQQLVKQNIFTTQWFQSSGFTTSASFSNNTIYGLTSASVAGLDSTYQVVGPGIPNATYVNSVVNNGDGTYNVVLSQAPTSSTTLTYNNLQFSHEFTLSSANTTLLITYGTVYGSFDVFPNAYVYGEYIPAGTKVVSSIYVPAQDWYEVTIDTPITLSGSVNETVEFYQSVSGGTFTFQKVKYAMPSDYDATVPRTHWDKSKRWEMLGPEDAQQWEWLLSGYISTGPRIRWRIFQDMFQIWPGVSYNEVLGFEYRSKGWAKSATGTTKNSMTADDDTCIYPDRLMVLGTKLKYFEAKGFDTTAMYRNYREELETCIAQNTSAANLSFAPRPGTVLIGYDNIPDSGYGN